MNKTYLWVIAIIALLLVGAGGYLIYRNSYKTTSNSSTATVPGAVSIQNFSFDPQTETVKAGETVTWTNNDSVTHKIKSANGNFDSTDLNPGDTFKHTFTEKGSFDYSCSIHPTMTGKVVVE